MTYKSDYSKAPPGVPNPYRPGLHNWKGGRYNEGSLYHGPNYTEPMFGLPRQPIPAWQYGPPGVAGLTETTNVSVMGERSMCRDANTRGGSFSPYGYGGGIFNLNASLGADELPLVVWGIPNAAFISIQAKMNSVLIASGLANMQVRVDGVLDESYCAAGRQLISMPSQTGNQYLTRFDDFIALQTESEKPYATAAALQCVANGYLKADTLPCSFPGSTNPNCNKPGPGPIPPGPGPLPAVVCPPGQILNPLTNQCVAPPIPPLPSVTCPPGQVLNPLTGQCMLIPVPPIVPPIVPPGVCPEGQTIGIDGKCSPIPPKPSGTCPPGQIADASGKCIPLPPTVVCPDESEYDAATKTCKKKEAAKASGSYLPWILVGAAAVGVGIYVVSRQRKKAR